MARRQVRSRSVRISVERLSAKRKNPESGIGVTPKGMRAFNERLVLSLVRHHGALSKMDLAKISGLSAQAVSVIARQLESDGLLRRGSPVRGRVGQPSVPLSLDPEGAMFLGVKIGRRSTEVVLVDFCGQVRNHMARDHDFPRPSATVDFVTRSVEKIRSQLGRMAGRIAGMGIAMPFQIWKWHQHVAAPEHVMRSWQDFDPRTALAGHFDFPVYLDNDATAACAAELAFGKHSHLHDFIYFYIGTFVGGGLVMNGRIYSGPSGNAGALGSVLVPNGSGGTEQLINQASLYLLQTPGRPVGRRRAASRSGAAWPHGEAGLEIWMQQAAKGLAHAIVSCTAVTDCSAVVIDGPFPQDIHDRLLARTRRQLGRMNTDGITAPSVLQGSVGSLARARGASSLPLFDIYLTERSYFIKHADR